MNFNLTIIRPKGFIHSSAFLEVRDSLAWSLAALGHQAILTENVFSSSSSTNIIFGAELFSPTAGIPADSIIYNFEQPSHPSMKNGNLRALCRGHRVWDFSPSNVQWWRSQSIDAIHVPVGFTPNLVRIPPSPTLDIDVCFFGWMTPRRTALIHELRRLGLNVYSSDACYGGSRDQILSRSKVCLNVHHDGRDLFEIVRVSYLLANSKCVVSELSRDDCDYERLESALLRCPYDHLASECEWAAKDDDIRRKLEEGSAHIRAMDYTPVVEAALDTPPAETGRAMPAGQVKLAPILDRYTRGCREGDMKDFLPLLRSLAKGCCVEIGTRDGASTSALLLGLEDHGGELHSIDISDCSGLWTHSQWYFTQANSHDIDIDPDSADLILIDGDHSPEGFLADLDNALRWAKPGGIILCHDITPLPSCTKEAAGGDWPSQYVGEQFFKVCQERKLRHFVYPGQWGLGVIIKDCAAEAVGGTEATP